MQRKVSPSETEIPLSQIQRNVLLLLYKTKDFTIDFISPQKITGVEIERKKVSARILKLWPEILNFHL